MPTLYIETTIVSYLTATPSGQVVAAARQLLTRRWWDRERRNYDLVTSQYVLDEASRGDSRFAEMHLEALKDIPLLDLPDEVPRLAGELLARSVLPPNARLDALHIATAAFHAVEYLLTWNCTHIANARILPRIREALADLSCAVPVICTPEEMVGDEYPFE